MNQTHIKWIQKFSPYVLWFAVFWFFIGRYFFDDTAAPAIIQGMYILFIGPFALAYVVIFTKLAASWPGGVEYVFSKTTAIVTVVALTAALTTAFLPITTETLSLLMICGGVGLAAIILMIRERKQLVESIKK